MTPDNCVVAMIDHQAERQRDDGSTVQSDNLEVSSCPSKPALLILSHLVVDQPEPNEK